MKKVKSTLVKMKIIPYIAEVSKIAIEIFESEFFETTSYLTSVCINPLRSKLVGVPHTRRFNNRPTLDS